MVVHLNEIDAATFEISDGFPCVLSVGNAPAKGPVWWRIVEDRSRRNNLGSEQFAAIDAVSERKDEYSVGTHVPSADHSICQKQIQGILSRRLMMRVHVPKSGNQKLSSAVQS
jgi:hypothetical protein